ncbi:MAG: sigma 54-interacting transcriptional regulator [Pseudomonadales bacterium]|nr:sigma 54-interacting transcriptional regulator [Pseudomonadales bacterium]
MSNPVSSLALRHQLILEAIGEGVYGIDAEGKATFVNAAAERILGWKAEDIKGQVFHDIHRHSHEDGRPYPIIDCPIFHALKDAVVHTASDEVFWHSDGRAVPVEYTSTPIIEEGEIRGAVVVFRDMTERRRHEEEQQRAFDEISALKEMLEQERDYLLEEVRLAKPQSGIIGQSQALQRTFSQIEAVANTPVAVLIQGESGVGKEAIARLIHEQSSRSQKPLIKVNCASIPEELFESEFFGHVKGAFTGAHSDRTGRLQLADGGTLFLDEIGEIPLSQQGKLLRALQEQEFERVGDATTRKVNVRVVSATNRDLMTEVRNGRFRQDLYYRLSVFPIDVPPLRERTEDIGALVHFFIEQVCEELGREKPRVTQHQIRTLQQHSWPGNVRELKNIIERAVILSGNNRLNLDTAFGQPARADNGQEMTTSAENFMTDEEMRLFQQRNLHKVLQQANWKISGPGGAAELMGAKPSTLTYRMQQLGIRKPAKENQG